MADATIDAFREVLDESLGELRKGVAGLSVDQLNARPAGGDTNSVAVIVTHALGSTRSWLSLAMGAPMPERDRPAEFRAVADDGFAARTDAGIAECLALLDDATWIPREWVSRTGPSHRRRGRPPTPCRTRCRISASMWDTCT